MEWERRVEQMGARLRKKTDAANQALWKALGSADVVWMAWEDTRYSRRFRVVRGRDLSGPGLPHGVIFVGCEVSGLALFEGRGYQVAVMDDGETAGIPEPPVPQAHIDMVMADQVLLCDGKSMSFRDVPTA
jgi:hypothetical protein